VAERSGIVSRGGSGRVGQIRVVGRIEGGTGLHRGTVRRYPSYGLTFVTAGAGRYQDSATSAPVAAGTLILVFPGWPHWYGSDGWWDENFVVFDGPLFDLAHRQGLISPGQPVHPGLPVVRWMRRLDAFRQRPRPSGESAYDAEAVELLHLLCEATQESARRAGRTGAAVDWLTRSVELLEGDLDERLSLPSVAEQVAMPYETWRRRFRDRTGLSPHQYRARHRLDTAADLLTHTVLSTREIAAALGFSDERHLIRRFRVRTGLTPRRYRDEHSN